MFGLDLKSVAMERLWVTSWVQSAVSCKVSTGKTEHVKTGWLKHLT